jgi:hypothetical protein
MPKIALTVLLLLLYNCYSKPLNIYSSEELSLNEIELSHERSFDNQLVQKGSKELNGLYINVSSLLHAVEDTDILLPSISIHQDINHSSVYTVSLISDYGYLSVIKITEAAATGRIVWETGPVDESTRSHSILIKGSMDDINALLQNILYSPPPNFHGLDPITLAVSYHSSVSGKIIAATKQKILVVVASVDDISTIVMKMKTVQTISYVDMKLLVLSNIEINDPDSDANYLILYLQCDYCEWVADVQTLGVSALPSTDSSVIHYKDKHGIYLAGSLSMLQAALPMIVYNAQISTSKEDTVVIRFVEDKNLSAIVAEGVLAVDIIGRTFMPTFSSNFISQSRVIKVQEDTHFFFSSMVKEIFILDPLVNTFTCRFNISWDVSMIHSIAVGNMSMIPLKQNNKNSIKSDKKIDYSVSMECNAINEFILSLIITPLQNAYCLDSTPCSKVNMSIEVPSSFGNTDLHIVHLPLEIYIRPVDDLLLINGPLTLQVSIYVFI